MWSRPYACRLLRTTQEPGVFRGLAQHDGYAGIRGKVIHWRGLTARSGGSLLVWDYLDGGGAHDVELRWHVGGFAGGSGGTWLLGENMVLAVSGGDAAEVLEGSMDPAGGWLSRGYGEKVPISTIRAVHRGPLPCEFVSRIYPRGSEPPERELTEDLENFRAWVRQP